MIGMNMTDSIRCKNTCKNYKNKTQSVIVKKENTWCNILRISCHPLFWWTPSQISLQRHSNVVSRLFEPCSCCTSNNTLWLRGSNGFNGYWFLVQWTGSMTSTTKSSQYQLNMSLSLCMEQHDERKWVVGVDNPFIPNRCLQSVTTLLREYCNRLMHLSNIQYLLKWRMHWFDLDASVDMNRKKSSSNKKTGKYCIGVYLLWYNECH